MPDWRGFPRTLINKKIGKFEYGWAKSPVSAVLADSETGLDLRVCNRDCKRYGAGKMRALDMAKYITEFYDIKQNSVGRPSENKKLATKLEGCANYLVFKRYLSVDEVRLHAANFCKKHLLCPFCAMRRGQSISKFTSNGWTLFYRKIQNSARSW